MYALRTHIPEIHTHTEGVKIKTIENYNSDENFKPQTWFQGDVDEVTFQSVKLDRACDIDLSQHASHPKNNPRWYKKRAQEEKTGHGRKNSARMDR